MFDFVEQAQCAISVRHSATRDDQSMPNRAIVPRHAREQFWRDLVARQQRSGQSIAAFCRAHGLSKPFFFSWRKLLRLRCDAPASFFVPVQIDLPAPLARAVPVEIVLRGGACIQVRSDCDRQMLQIVLAVLEPPPC